MGEDMESPLQGQVINPLQRLHMKLFEGFLETVLNLAKISLTKEKVVSLFEYYHTFLQKRENSRVIFVHELYKKDILVALINSDWVKMHASHPQSNTVIVVLAQDSHLHIFVRQLTVFHELSCIKIIFLEFKLHLYYKPFMSFQIVLHCSIILIVDFKHYQF